jgi:hypothetical protein
MTTRDFIAQTYNTTNDRWGKFGYERWCSSVMTDKDGVVYSYGHHYPLAFNLKGLDFINTEGYSVTTSKHISWAWQALGSNAISVKLWREDSQVIASSASEEQKLEAVYKALERELQHLWDAMASKKRRNTPVYADLEWKAELVARAQARVR